ncbi:hypothetical protein FIS3754_09390 [Fischerella sp. NIES-3754]|nr:hypothetical protein FIS3754_09390 [Fischerella sp. NIES-3754]BCX07300.1 MAG: hypothetical protein KatS3mg066_1159 [Fischerella sp.]
MNLQFTGMTRRSRDVALLRLYVWSMIWHRTTEMYAHIIHDQIQQRLHNKSKIFTLNLYPDETVVIILAAVTWAVYALAQKKLLKSLSSSNIMLMIYGGCTLFFSVFAKPKTIFNLD